MFKNLFEISIKLNICLCSTFILIGCIGGLITLSVLWHAHGKLPKICAQNYLGMLTIANCLFLVLHWYINTSQIIITYFKLINYKFLFFFLNLVNSNNLVCKSMNFAYVFCRCLSTYLTLTFSFERTIATYFPFKIVSYKQHSHFIFKIVFIGLILFSFMVSIQSFQNYQLIRLNTNSNEIYDPKFFHLNAICDIAEEHFSRHAKFTYIFVLLMLIFPVILVILLNISIFLRMNRKKNYLNVNQYFSINIQTTQRLKRFLSFKSEATHQDNTVEARCCSVQMDDQLLDKCGEGRDYEESLDTENQVSNVFLKKNDNFCVVRVDLNKEGKDKTRYVPKPHLVVLNKTTGHVSLYGEGPSKNTKLSRLEFVRNEKSLSKDSVNSSPNNPGSSLCNDLCLKKRASLTRPKFKIHCINHKFYKTKILILLTTVYVLSNFPYFLNIIIANEMYNFTSNYTYLKNGYPVESYLKYRYHSFLLLSEILYIFNYSISGYILFSYGKIYRLHLKSLWSKIAAIVFNIGH
ncbi:hypothetical protein BpHYR1_039790 [Brachionus plicatilis]|uniref:G-protein coupled receptors family 1 profile domain-containing protein n=1 Tax=Brachionus plicatilis TaxID=10195 RepID=A0A3M7PHN8_BRAPC|nr:hypothetical protein BpHYR1_039790 [Brachionus plicatilis]